MGVDGWIDRHETAAAWLLWLLIAAVFWGGPLGLLWFLGYFNPLTNEHVAACAITKVERVRPDSDSPVHWFSYQCGEMEPPAVLGGANLVRPGRTYRLRIAERTLRSGWRYQLVLAVEGDLGG